VQVQTDQHNDALPLARQGDRHWEAYLAPRAGRNAAWVDDRLLVQRRWGDWQLGFTARNLATVVASEQALSLAAQVAQARRPATDQAWQADVHMRGFAGLGPTAGRRHALGDGWQAHWDVQALLLTRWRERDISGPVQFAVATGQYSFNLASQERDNRLKFPFQQPFAAHGTGLLAGGGLAWEGTKAFASLGLRDGGWLAWRGQPAQQAVLNTATQSTDANGFLIYQPLVQGQNSQGSAARWMPWRGQVQAGIKLENGHQLAWQADTLPGGIVLPRLQWRLPAPQAGAWGWQADWRLHERSLGLGADWQGWQLRLASDGRGASSRTRAFSLAYGTAY